LSRTTRKYNSIDIMKLWTLGSANGWNKKLEQLAMSNSINECARIRYQLQAGMDDLVKQKLNTEEMNIFYLRLMKSIENTARTIVRRLHPLPHDIPQLHGDTILKPAKALEIKRKRDSEMEKFFNQSSF
jgi:hypothetical protein